MIIEECNSKHRPTCNTSSRVPALSCRRRSIEQRPVGKEEEFLRISLIEELRGKRWVASPQKSLLNKDSADLNSWRTPSLLCVSGGCFNQKLLHNLSTQVMLGSKTLVNKMMGKEIMGNEMMGNEGPPLFGLYPNGLFTFGLSLIGLQGYLDYHHLDYLWRLDYRCLDYTPNRLHPIGLPMTFGLPPFGLQTTWTTPQLDYLWRLDYRRLDYTPNRLHCHWDYIRLDY